MAVHDRSTARCSFLTVDIHRWFVELLGRGGLPHFPGSFLSRYYRLPQLLAFTSANNMPSIPMRWGCTDACIQSVTRLDSIRLDSTYDYRMPVIIISSLLMNNDR
jgi:hypothetical protein